ncbi:transmembrane protease serine 9-like [Trichoplusia ni]|uniref:Transmembrane protease serine 9-like n=1 Tax=Trichoplusia ni TaxID=7111 RepID=A0A7E5W0V4_TRINI|nr:transmembrane protease serine 9-like [Trichoplusia ni]
MSLAFETKTAICILICFHFHLILATHRYNYVRHLVPKTINSSLRVHNGKPVQLGEIPYQVGFKTRSRNLYVTFCGGSIIGESKLLSAAHCFVEDVTGVKTLCQGQTEAKSLRNTYAVAATIRNYASARNTDRIAQWRTLRNLIYPDDYKFPDNDIAILIVTSPFVFNKYVQPINLANAFIDYSGLCLVSGYGRISYDILSDSLMKAHLELLPERWCSMVHNRDMSKFVCTSLIETDIGHGDSGGPLVCAHTGDPGEKNGTGILVGVASGTYEQVNSIFSRVSKFRAFIEKNSCVKTDGASFYFVTFFVLPNIYDLFAF